jgi:hypothetical protein
MVLVSLQRERVFCSCRTGRFLNSLKKVDVYVINVRRDICSMDAEVGSNNTKSNRSVQRVAPVSARTAWEICRYGSYLFPYSMKLSQSLSKGRTVRRCSFGKGRGALLEDCPGVLSVTWLVVAYFHWMVTLTSNTTRTIREEKRFRYQTLSDPSYKTPSFFGSTLRTTTNKFPKCSEESVKVS